jgi:hypothetical protein
MIDKTKIDIIIYKPDDKRNYVELIHNGNLICKARKECLTPNLGD